MSNSYVTFHGKRYPSEIENQGRRFRLCESADAPSLAWLVYASDDGRVFVVKPGRKGPKPAVPKQTRKANGYLSVSIAKLERTPEGKTDYWHPYVQELVLTAFDRPRPNGCIATHRDDDAHNNRIENLFWGTHSSNASDRHNHRKEKTSPKNKFISIQIRREILDKLRTASRKKGEPLRLLIEKLLIRALKQAGH